MFPYRVTYNESESDIRNNDLLYKPHRKCQNAFELWEHFGKIEEFQKILFLFCNMYKLHNSYFVFFCCKFYDYGFVGL